MRTSIVLMGCSQPSRLAPERAPLLEAAFDVPFQNPPSATPVTQHGMAVLDGVRGAAVLPEPIRIRVGQGFGHRVYCQQVEPIGVGTFFR